MQVSKPETEGWLGRHIYNQFDNYQLNEYTQAVEATNNKRVALDIGANLGMMSARMVRDFEFVHAFEPVVAEHLKKNVNVDNIKIYDTAVGDKPGKATIRVGMYHSGGSNIVQDSKRETNQTYSEVNVVTIDEYNFENVDFIKIDVEGYEWFVLQGCTDTIDKNKPVILMEVHNESVQKYRKEIFKFMKDRGYGFKFVGELDCLFTLSQ